MQNDDNGAIWEQMAMYEDTYFLQWPTKYANYAQPSQNNKPIYLNRKNDAKWDLMHFLKEVENANLVILGLSFLFMF